MINQAPGAGVGQGVSRLVHLSLGPVMRLEDGQSVNRQGQLH
jgi:hypothetical protein